MDGSPTAIADSERASLAAWVTSVSASDHKSSQQRKGRATHEPRLAYLPRHTAPEPPPHRTQPTPWHFLLGVFAAREFFLTADNVWGLPTAQHEAPDSRQILVGSFDDEMRRGVAFLSSLCAVVLVWWTRLIVLWRGAAQFRRCRRILVPAD